MLKWTSKPSLGSQESMQSSDARETEYRRTDVGKSRPGTILNGESTCPSQHVSAPSIRFTSFDSAMSKRMSNLPFSYTDPVASQRTEYPYLKRLDEQSVEKTSPENVPRPITYMPSTPNSPLARPNPSPEYHFPRSKSMPRLESPISLTSSLGTSKKGILSKVKKLFRKSKDDADKRRSISQPSSPKVAGLSKSQRKGREKADTSSPETAKAKLARLGVPSTRLTRRIHSLRSQRKKLESEDIGPPIISEAVVQVMADSNEFVRDEGDRKPPSTCDESNQPSSSWSPLTEPRLTFETFRMTAVDAGEELTRSTGRELISPGGNQCRVNHIDLGGSTAQDHAEPLSAKFKVQSDAVANELGALFETVSEMQIINQRGKNMGRPRSSYSRTSLQPVGKEHPLDYPIPIITGCDTDSLNSLKQFADDLEAMLEAQPKEEDNSYSFELSKSGFENDNRDFRKQSLIESPGSKASYSAEIEKGERTQKGIKSFILNEERRSSGTNQINRDTFGTQSPAKLMLRPNKGNAVLDQQKLSSCDRKVENKDRIRFESVPHSINDEPSVCTETHGSDLEPPQHWRTSGSCKEIPDAELRYNETSIPNYSSPETLRLDQKENLRSGATERSVCEVEDQHVTSSHTNVACSQMSSASSLNTQAISLSFTSKHQSLEKQSLREAPNAKNNNNGHTVSFKKEMVMETENDLSGIKEGEKYFKVFDLSKTKDNMHTDYIVGMARHDHLHADSKEESHSSIRCSPVRVKSIVNHLEQQIKNKVEKDSGVRPHNGSQPLTVCHRQGPDKVEFPSVDKDETRVAKKTIKLHAIDDRFRLESKDTNHRDTEELSSPNLKLISQNSVDYQGSSTHNDSSTYADNLQSPLQDIDANNESDKDLSTWDSHSSDTQSLYSERMGQFSSDETVSKVDSAKSQDISQRQQMEKEDDEEKGGSQASSSHNALTLSVINAELGHNGTQRKAFDEKSTESRLEPSSSPLLPQTLDASIGLLEGEGITDVTPPCHLVEVNSSPGELESIADHGKLNNPAKELDRDKVKQCFENGAPATVFGGTDKTNTGTAGSASGFKRRDSILSPANKPLSPIKKTVSFKLDTTPTSSTSRCTSSDDAAICETISFFGKTVDTRPRQLPNNLSNTTLTDQSIDNESCAISCKSSASPVRVVQTSSPSGDDLSWWGADNDGEFQFSEDSTRTYGGSGLKPTSSSLEEAKNSFEVDFIERELISNHSVGISETPEVAGENKEMTHIPAAKSSQTLEQFQPSTYAHVRQNGPQSICQGEHKSDETQKEIRLCSASEQMSSFDKRIHQKDNVIEKTEPWAEPSESNSNLHTYNINIIPLNGAESLKSSELADDDLDGLVFDRDASSALSDLIDHVESSVKSVSFQSTLEPETKSTITNKPKSLNKRSESIFKDIPFWEKDKFKKQGAQSKRKRFHYRFKKQVAVKRDGNTPVVEKQTPQINYPSNMRAAQEKGSKPRRRTFKYTLAKSSVSKTKQLLDDSNCLHSLDESPVEPEAKEIRNCKGNPKPNPRMVVKTLKPSLEPKNLLSKTARPNDESKETARRFTATDPTHSMPQEVKKTRTAKNVAKCKHEFSNSKSNKDYGTTVTFANKPFQVTNMNKPRKSCSPLRTGRSSFTKHKLTRPLLHDNPKNLSKEGENYLEDSGERSRSPAKHGEPVEIIASLSKHERSSNPHTQVEQGHVPIDTQKSRSIRESGLEAGFSSDSASDHPSYNKKRELSFRKNTLGPRSQGIVHTSNNDSSGESSSSSLPGLTYSVSSHRGAYWRRAGDRSQGEDTHTAKYDNLQPLQHHRAPSCLCRRNLQSKHCQCRQCISAGEGISTKNCHYSPEKAAHGAEKTNATDTAPDAPNAAAPDSKPGEGLFIATFFMFQILLHWLHSSNHW